MKEIIVILMVIPVIIGAHLHLNDITPEEAQEFFAQQSLDLNYARKLNEIPLPLLRSETGKDYSYNGRKIANLEDYVEQTYQAEQFHGQDGLGRAMFGYTDHNQARLEARNANGDVRGSYQYVDPYGENIIVQYWSDSLGFHQTDNRPKIVLEPVTDTPEVQAARLEHERAWKEAARLAKADPDPMSDIYNRGAIAYDSQVEADAAEATASVANQAQGLARYPNLSYDQHITPEKSGGVGDSIVIASAGSVNVEKKSKSLRNHEDTESEIPSVPRGFFYKFDYPVNLIAETPSRRAARLQQELESEQHEGIQKVRRHGESSNLNIESKDKSLPSVVAITENKNVDIDSKVDLKKSDEQTQIARVSLRAMEEGSIPVDAVHDVQVHPKQKADLVNSQVLPVSIDIE